MSPKKVMLFGAAWLVLITGLHAWLNVNWDVALNNFKPPAQRKIIVAYIPVTCQLTCPVTDYISKFSENGELFLPRMFQGFPEIKEALISNKVQAAFIVAPLAILIVAGPTSLKPEVPLVRFTVPSWVPSPMVSAPGPLNVPL